LKNLRVTRRISMGILIDKDTRYLIQGITGKQGKISCEDMIANGAKVVCGVTPGKGGQEVCKVPVFDSVKLAKEKFEIDCSIIYVPPKYAKDALVDSINSKIPLVVLVTENVPVHDMVYCLELAKKNNVRVLGGSSVGIVVPGQTKCGSIGTGASSKVLSPGHVAVLSKSGGMALETALVVQQAGYGQSIVIGLGGDYVQGTSYLELVKELEKDEKTKIIVLYCEIGGRAEEDLAKYLIEQNYSKPIVAFVAGGFANKLQYVSLGHAGAIVEGSKGSKKSKQEALKKAGVHVVELHHEIGEVIKVLLKKDVKQMELKTRVSKISDNDVIIRNQKLSDLVGTKSFSFGIFLLLIGRNPNDKEEKIFEAILLSIIEHGMATTSSMATRFVASGGSDLNVAVAGGILSQGNYHGGAIENAMEQFYSFAKLSEIDLRGSIKAMVLDKEIVYGFGHKHYKNGDPRVKWILNLCKEQEYDLKFWGIRKIIEDVFLEIKGKPVYINIDGLIAIFLCGLKVDPKISKGVFVIGRVPGLVAQAYEELSQEKPVRRFRESDVVYID
jgi:succinyl-CoA synthetase alpha subunit